MSEQVMLPSGLHVEKSTEQPAPCVDSRGPAEGVGDRGDFDGDVTRPHRGEQDPGLQLAVDGVTALGAGVSLVECIQ